ncbi:MAG: peptide deformylase [Flavobacteriaceae bacterium]|nr:peptide deformylase [Flavobacteriaceae bacterium]
MILPILAFGSKVLKKKATIIKSDYPELDKVLNNLWETMYAASGVGLAAPQVGISIRLFIVDGNPFCSDEEIDENEREELKVFKKVFINPVIEEHGKEWVFKEGCLSIPEIKEDIIRKDSLIIKYYDENFIYKKEEYTGLPARIIQHEFDHLEGILFTDKISSLKKKLLKGKLMDISKGKVDVNYLMKFPLKNKNRVEL